MLGKSDKEWLSVRTFPVTLAKLSVRVGVSNKPLLKLKVSLSVKTKVSVLTTVSCMVRLSAKVY